MFKYNFLTLSAVNKFFMLNNETYYAFLYINSTKSAHITDRKRAILKEQENVNVSQRNGAKREAESQNPLFFPSY